VDQIKNFSETYLTEAFTQLRLLEDDINLSDIGEEEDELTALVPDDIPEEEEVSDEYIIDPEAKTVDQLEDDYEGKVILKCNCCGARHYVDAYSVKIDNDTANSDDDCPLCGNKLGFTVIGKIGKFSEEPEEVEDEEEEVEEESLTEGAMSLRDRIARKHLEADESLEDEENQEDLGESALREDNWDKLVDTYPELEDGEVHEELKDKEVINERCVKEDLGDDAADFLWEGNKITVDGEDYEIISMGADVLTVEDADGKTVEFDLAELAGKPYSVVDYDGEYYEHKPSVGESLTEDDDEDDMDKDDICPECGKNPCECKKHGHHHCEEGCGKKLHEDYSNVLNDINDMSKGDTVVMCINGNTGRFTYIGTSEDDESGVKVYQFEPLDKNSAALAKAFTEDELGLDFNGLYELTDEDIFYNPFYNETKDLVYLGDSEGFEDEIADGIKKYLKSDEVTEGCEKRVNEAVEVHASGEDEVDVSKNDDGSMTINVGQAQVEGESVVPLSDEEQAALEANSEEPVEDELAAEEPTEEEVPEEGTEESTEEEEAPAEEEEEEQEVAEESLNIYDFADGKFNSLVEQFMSKVYNNIKTFTTTNVKDLSESFSVTGEIKFKSGATQKSNFVFEDAYFSKSGKLVMEGYNTTFSGKRNAFKITGKLEEGKYTVNSMIYDYTATQLNESNKNETVKIYGRVK